jgi:hypothetical protein
MIIMKIYDESVDICHKFVNGGGALSMMRGRNENPQPSVVVY